MAPTGTERKVMMIIQDLKEATKSQISKRLGLSTDYIEYVSQYLVLGGYLTVTKGSSPLRKYSLTPEGERVLGGYAGFVGAQSPFGPGASPVPKADVSVHE